jgi:hypothetical protein
MPEYKAPLRDMKFVMDELLNAGDHYAALSGCAELTDDLREAIVTEAAKFSEQVLSPINRSGDEEGCHWNDGVVTTPAGFKEAYQQYIEGGWTGIAAPEANGGQNLPGSIGVLINELIGSANWAWSMYPGLSMGAVRCIHSHGSDEQKNLYLDKLVEGVWSGTMCLTESHCGSDLGMLRTKAVANPDGSYDITGNKIFISGGEQDLTENIIHMVLARVEGAPAGTKGISLFIVPKFMPDADGNPGERNGVSCGSIEHKMGINGSATCVMNFDEAKGFIVGEENAGLAKMFTFMNAARLGTALQGLSLGEAAFQGGVSYATDRLQMRSLTGPKNPDGPADPIVVHPDVRRMLLTQKAFVEGTRAFLYWLGLLVDKVDNHPDEKVRKESDDLLGFLTPISKAFATETGFEVANHGVQIYGGHGYIREWGMEQIVRDARIAMVYEGTTGIQALDLIGRKVLGSGGELLKGFTKMVHVFCKEHEGDEAIASMVSALQEKNKELGELTMEIGAKAMENPDEVGAASVDYLMYCGYVILGYLWARMAKIASDKLAEGSEEKAFYTAKLQTANFYFDKLLPRTLSHAATARTGSATLMAIDAEHLIL